MATEDIRIEDGRILVERAEHKVDVDVAVSDVELVTFTRGVGGGAGALLLHTVNGDVLIRVDNEDAGKALTALRTARVDIPNEDTEAQDDVTVETVDAESTPVAVDTSTNNGPIDPPVRAPGRGNRSNR